MRNVSDRGLEKIKTHFVFNNYFSKIVPFMRKCGKKYSRAGQAMDGSVAHAHCMLDTKGCKHTLRIL
jgi:hypothetical protein